MEWIWRDQLIVSYEVDHLNKFQFYLWVFFDFLDITVVNSRLVYNKMESSSIPIFTMGLRYSIALNIIQNFSSRRSAVPSSRPLKRSIGESFDFVDHFPAFAISRARCILWSLRKVENRAYTRCVSYALFLCLQKDRKCFQSYHTEK